MPPEARSPDAAVAPFMAATTESLEAASTSRERYASSASLLSKNHLPRLSQAESFDP